jgi:hypothetical protein
MGLFSLTVPYNNDTLQKRASFKVISLFMLICPYNVSREIFKSFRLFWLHVLSFSFITSHLFSYIPQGL